MANKKSQRPRSAGMVQAANSILSEAIPIAVEALSWIDLEEISEKTALSKAFNQLRPKRFAAFRLAHKIVFETLRQRNFIDALISSVMLHEDFEAKSLGLQNFLRVFCLLKLKGLKSVELLSAVNAGRRSLGWQSFRHIESSLASILAKSAGKIFSEYSGDALVSIKTWMPLWLTKYLVHCFGRSFALQILRSYMHPTSTYLKFNNLAESNMSVISLLKKDGIAISPVPGVDRAYKVLQARRTIPSTTTYKSGLIQIQDLSSILAIMALNPEKNSIILDVCATPGGKTSLIAESTSDQAMIISLDKHAVRFSVWKREMRRLHVRSVYAVLADCTEKLPLHIEADYALVDPPCSNTGTFARYPAGKWQLTPERIHGYPEIQHSLLTSTARSVKTGGCIVYSTCSITEEENECVIGKFLKHAPEFELVETGIPLGVPGRRGLHKTRRLYPHLHDCSGFFIAKMRRQY